MNEIKEQLNEFCPKCQKVENTYGVRTTRSVEDADGNTKNIVTISYTCESCNTFVRAEEHEAEEKKSISA